MSNAAELEASVVLQNMGVEEEEKKDEKKEEEDPFVAMRKNSIACVTKARTERANLETQITKLQQTLASLQEKHAAAVQQLAKTEKAHAAVLDIDPPPVADVQPPLEAPRA